MAVTGTDDPTAINCLTQNDWRLDMATDNFYQDPMKFFVEGPRAAVDKRKIESLFAKYRSESACLALYGYRYNTNLVLSQTFL